MKFIFIYWYLLASGNQNRHTYCKGALRSSKKWCKMYVYILEGDCTTYGQCYLTWWHLKENLDKIILTAEFSLRQSTPSNRHGLYAKTLSTTVHCPSMASPWSWEGLTFGLCLFRKWSRTISGLSRKMYSFCNSWFDCINIKLHPEQIITHKRGKILSMFQTDTF